MKNYYDELEISKTASKEVIEKVYKVLAKKYHPDTTKEADKHAAEEKFKAINKAYEILSDNEKRKKYDFELEQSNSTISYEEYIKVVNERDKLNTILNQQRNSSTNNYQYRKNYSNSTNYNFQNPNSQYTPKENLTSIFDSFRYKIKDFFSSLIILIFSILIAVLIVEIFTKFNFLNFIFK